MPPSSQNIQEFPADDDVRRILQKRIDEKLSVGLSVGLLDSQGPRFVAAGTSGNPARPQVDELTIFEIGSITKVFTAAALADAVAHGIIALDDPISRFLSLPVNGIGNRTLKEFVTHTTGLPRLPSGFAWKWNLLRHPGDPYASYSESDLYAYVAHLNGNELRRGRFLYSNLGAGLLGHALAASENTDYASYVARHVTAPLGMQRTWLDIPASDRTFVAQPHNRFLRPTNLWTMNVLAGAGGLRSCMRDMLLFASAALGPIAPLSAAMFQPLAPAGSERNVGFGWMLRHSACYQVAWHNGGTGGSRAFLGLEFQTQRAVIVLSNSSHSVDQLGADLLLGPPLAANFF